MSVIVLTKFAGKASALEALVAEQGHVFEQVSKESQSVGAIHHLFVEDTDGDVLVIDEWESAQAFETFFAAQEDIKRIAAAAGVTSPPTSTAYRILDTPDRF